MLKDIIEEEQKKALNKLAQYLHDNHKVEEAYQSLDLVIAETAQIVAREVTDKVKMKAIAMLTSIECQENIGWNNALTDLIIHLQSLEESINIEVK